jgi:TetR/AcrR family transcriptional regulator, fatty acid metabolism regulator protein
MKKEDLIAISAINIFSKVGFHVAKVQQIANNAGVAVGTIYNYFKSKDEILNYILEKEYMKRIDFLSNIKGDNLCTVEIIQNYLAFNLDIIKENPRIAKILAQESAYPGGYISIRARELKTLAKNMMIQIISDGQNKGEIRKIDVNMLAQIIRMSINGIIFTEPFDGSEETYEKLKNGVIEFIGRAIKS